MKHLKHIVNCAALLIALLSGALANAATTITYYHNDLLGSPVAATDASGHVIWRERYRPYGERLTNDPASTGNDVWYTSRRQDADTGLVYMGARYYDPVVGRFVSKDPVGFDEGNIQSFNRYAYANDNPYKYVDPDGRQAAQAIQGIVRITPVALRALAAVGGALGAGIYNATHSDDGGSEKEPSSKADEANSPKLPDQLVGVQDDKSGQQGNRVNNGPLDPKHGGTGDPEKDFDKLTGGKHGPAPADSTYPPGTRLGDNGVTFRPPREDSGARIDIPASGTKPHETLHYP